MTRIAAAKPLDEILETDWDATLFRGAKSLAVQLGWTSYHTLRSKGSKTGYPDRTLVRDRILFVELKRERTQPTDDQVAWLDKLAAAGGECYLWRPSDLDEIAQVLSKRWLFETDPWHCLRANGFTEEFWTPASLWIPGRGRSDTTEQQTLLTKGAAA